MNYDVEHIKYQVFLDFCGCFLQTSFQVSIKWIEIHMSNESGLYCLQQNTITASGPREKRKGGTVYLIRPELSLILNIYGKMVASGEWFDYAIDMQPERATFSVYRRASEMPLYRIIKEPALASKQGMWRIVSMTGQVVKRGKVLDVLLRYFDSKLMKLID